MKKLSEVFKKVHSEILNNSEVVSLNLYREDRVMELTAKCVKMVRYESVKALENQILSAYSLRDISLQFVYDKDVFNENSVKVIAGYLKDFPQLMPVIENASCEIDGNTLKINCLSANIIGEDARQAFSDEIKKMFDLDIDVQFVQDKTDDELMQQFEADKAAVEQKIQEIHREKAEEKR